jgi:L-ribulose-5-phosphate 3-epimerase
MNLSDSHSVSFASGFALQGYHTAEEGLHVACENGYQHWYIDFSLPTEILDTWTPTRINQLLLLLKQWQLAPIFHGNFKVPLASDVSDLRKAAVNYTKKEIDIAAYFKAPLIIHGGGIVEPRHVRQAKLNALDNLLFSLEELISYANNLGVTLWLENLSNYQFNHPFYYIFTHEEEFDYILSRCDIKLFMDIGHANIGNTDIYRLFESFYSRIAGISISNNDGSRDQHLSLSKGNINYLRLFGSLIQLNWKGPVGLEIRDLSPKNSLLDVIALYHEANSAALKKAI